MSGFGQASVSILYAFCPLFVAFKTWKCPAPETNLHSPFFYDSNHADKKKHFAHIDPGCPDFHRFSVRLL
jgi:hypothetical protein